jgi:hypothetical protein
LPVQGCIIASQQRLSCLHQALIHHWNELQSRRQGHELSSGGFAPFTMMVLQQQLFYANVLWLECCHCSPRSAVCGVKDISD